MQIHSELPAAALLQDCALTVGTFDGVHRGHQVLVAKLREAAARRALPAVVLTFADMPYHHFDAAGCAKLLTLPEEKADAFARLGIDHLFLVPFDAGVASQSAGEFVGDVLVGKLGMRHFISGPDFALGKGRQGDIPALRALGAEYGYEVEVLGGKVAEAGEPISSTRTRNCVESGDVAMAARLLDHPFNLSGEVVRGQQLGRSIGVPTINLRPHPRKVVPAHGVYAVRAFLDGDSTPRRAALNIGTRPTVDGVRETIEFHVIGEEIALAPRSARLELVERLREERKFAGLDALVEQIHRDLERAGQLLAL